MTPRFKEKCKRIVIEPFGYSVHVVLSNDIRRSAKKRRDVLGEVVVSAGMVAFTIVMPRSGIGPYLFLPEKSDFNTVPHEAFHCIHFILQECGVKFEEEVYAYHIGYLSEKLVDFIRKSTTKKGTII